MSFRSDELRRALRWMAATTTLSEGARRPGVYTGATDATTATRDGKFLHEAHCTENLLPAVREEALGIFRRFNLPWHEGPDRHTPSNYLLDSMVSSVNALMPFARDGRAFARLLSGVVPGAIDAAVVEEDRVLAFEWIGRENYLGETSPGRGRGEKGTSADAYALLRLASGERVGVLIEWKFTEQYRTAEFKKWVVRRYGHLLDNPDSPIDTARAGGADALAYDPFYQLARLQLLADKMERAKENGADRVVLVLVVPKGNRDYLDTLTSPELAERYAGRTVPEVFSALLRRPERFRQTTLAALLGPFPDPEFPHIEPALAELRLRYLG